GRSRRGDPRRAHRLAGECRPLHRARLSRDRARGPSRLCRADLAEHGKAHPAMSWGLPPAPGVLNPLCHPSVRLPGDDSMAVSAATQPSGVYAAALTPLNAALEPDPVL